MKKVHNTLLSRLSIMLVALLTILVCTFAITTATSYAASITYSKGYVNSKDGVILRANASKKSPVVTTLANNTKVTITKEVFNKDNSTKANKRWYCVWAGGKKGYIRSDLVDNITYSTVTGTAVDALNYRVGPSTNMKKVGTMPVGTTVTVQMVAKVRFVNEKWYRIATDTGSYYVKSNFIRINTEADVAVSSSGKVKTAKPSANRSDIANALLTKATNGGSCRTVYSLTANNCYKKWKGGVVGTKSAKVPQGMAFTGTEYCVVYAMNNTKQAISRYNLNGKKLQDVQFPKNIGHVNGMTWNPTTGMYYIFKGNHHPVYTYCPSKGKWGTVKTPYSSSGIAYDLKGNIMYASSTAGIRIYSGDGKFTHDRIFNKCSHSGKTYVQDCGASSGFIFHCVSGKNKTKNNYIDVYRAADSAYLGTLTVGMGEVESCIINSQGYLEVLCNTPGTPDYIWVTPLNVIDLQ